MWEPQIPQRPKGWRLITPDLRGFGGSTSDNGTPTMDDYAVDVMGLLGELESGRAVVGGCSMGGYATFALLKRAPDLAIGVVLSDTRTGADSPEGRANRRSMLALVDREGPSGIARDMMPKLIGETTRADGSHRGVHDPAVHQAAVARRHPDGDPADDGSCRCRACRLGGAGADACDCRRGRCADAGRGVAPPGRGHTWRLPGDHPAGRPPAQPRTNRPVQRVLVPLSRRLP